jgi:cyclic-di-GMP phosphodiesterase TipF (flagellum assembly factor)
MRGLGSLFIAICMALIAASAGAVAHFWAGYSPTEASLAAFALLFAMMTYQVFAARRRDRAEMAGRYEDLAHATANIAHEVGEIGRRVSALEGAPVADLRSVTGPLAQEMDALVTRVEEIADVVAARDTRPAPAKSAEVPARGEQTQPEPIPGHNEEDKLRLLRESVDAGRIELYLQPVVTLPQRKVRFYEALSRIKLADGSLIEPKRFLESARAFGLLPRIDLRMMRSCVQVVRRLAAMNREVGLFVNFSRETLADASYFGYILALLGVNRALSPSLIIEISQEAFRSLGPAEHERMSALAECGFRFALDHTEDLRIDPRALAERGVRFVKVPVEIMLQHRRFGSAVHPADLADLLGRQGIDLVVIRIENEGAVVDLLDHDVRYGQGFLFAPPRPVRAEVLSGRVPELEAAEKILVEAAAGPDR